MKKGKKKKETKTIWREKREFERMTVEGGRSQEKTTTKGWQQRKRKKKRKCLRG